MDRVSSVRYVTRVFGIAVRELNICDLQPVPLTKPSHRALPILGRFWDPGRQQRFSIGLSRGRKKLPYGMGTSFARNVLLKRG